VWAHQDYLSDVLGDALGSAWSAARAPWLALWLATSSVAFGGCACPSEKRPDGHALPTAANGAGPVSRERVRALREREAPLRSAFSPREQPPWIDVSGADPYRIAAEPNGPGYVGILRGDKALVTLAADLHELARVALSESPTALCVAKTNDAWVASRYGRQLVRVGLGPGGAAMPTLHRELPLAGVADLACGENGEVYVQPADEAELLVLDADGRELGRFAALHGGLRLQRRGHFLLELSLFERTLRVLELGPRGLPSRELGRIHHDGTLWGFDAAGVVGDTSQLLVALSGVEDKALVRAHGEFENIDSFVWLYRLGERGFEQLAAINTSDYGVVVPKALRFGPSAAFRKLSVLAAGSGRMLRVDWGGDVNQSPRIWTEPAPPGASDAAWDRDGGLAYASPLLDAWIKLDASGSQLARARPERRPEPEVRLGEALFFTELMAPSNASAGTHSRFSCETCHFEGGVDGRVHYTGRADVSVVTKPLFGLANNRPHFSRAMDPDLSSVAHNEFRVAGAGSGTEPWFSLENASFPWLHELGIDGGVLSPLDLRAALLKFLYAFSHAPNPRSQGREHFTALEAAGAHAFDEHCQSCHAARLLSDDAGSAVAFAGWEALVFSRNAPLVWARGDYAKTGVLPYVHERGTRITSLRRLALKPRYFTNGSAPDLASVLARFRGDGSSNALHDAAAGSGFEPLPAETQRALLAFLQLL
jgi:hypothetical protein